MVRRSLTGLLGLALAVAALPVAAAASPRTTVFNDLAIDEPVAGDVVAFEADVRLGPRADVAGDVVVIGGELELADGARVGRHVVAVFGCLRADPGAVVAGRTLVFSSLSAVALRPDDGESLQVDLAVRLLSSGGWLLVTTALAFGFSARLRFGVWLLPGLGLRVLVLGVAAGLTFFAAVVAALGLGPSLGMPLAAALTVVFFAVRAVGLTVIGGFLGAALLRWRSLPPLPLTLEVFLGVLVLEIARFVPLIGGVVWSLCALAALGAGILTLAADPRAAVAVDPGPG
ncbi:MAG TPA: hypothetical protein VLT32_11670 [Candidatus Sulfomarinibacteraceae bacterium]|nr:hypothetical protein [Candidatus Sulfomarinibacteraceae bacterium]